MSTAHAGRSGCLVIVDDRLKDVAEGLLGDNESWVTVSGLADYPLTIKAQWGTAWTWWSWVGLPPRPCAPEVLWRWLRDDLWPDAETMVAINDALGL
jgi:hypothetical protein